jgi:hypothetical protein
MPPPFRLGIGGWSRHRFKPIQSRQSAESARMRHAPSTILRMVPLPRKRGRTLRVRAFP